MERNVGGGTVAETNAGSPPSAAWHFAQALLGKPVPDPAAAAANAQAKREHLAWLASISARHERELRRLSSAEAEARAKREQLEWLAKISSKHERQLRGLLAAESEARETHERLRRFGENSNLQEWDPSKHPRGGFPENRGWFSPTGSSGLTRSLFDAIIKRNRDVHDLTGILMPEMIRSSRLAADLESAAKLPDDVARAAAAGLLTGTKAVVNGSVTAVKNVATLGLSTSQLELIGVTKEDRARGYDTAVAISTASGELLIAVGTSGLSSALSKGGSIARTARGALVAFDAAGNAVGVVQGIYDAAQNGVTIQNGAQIAAGALGLGANAKAVRDLSRASAALRRAEVDEFVATVPRKTTPTRSAANEYEVKHAGPHNYTISGGGESFDIDGYRGSTILEAKHVGRASDSPYIPGSSCPSLVREKILAKVREEFRKVGTIIASGSTPFKSVEIITNSPEAKTVFETILKESRVPGTVRLAP